MSGLRRARGLLLRVAFARRAAALAGAVLLAAFAVIRLYEFGWESWLTGRSLPRARGLRRRAPARRGNRPPARLDRPRRRPGRRVGAAGTLRPCRTGERGAAGAGQQQFLSGAPIRYYRPRGSAEVRQLIDDGFQAFNAGRLSEACHVYAEPDARPGARYDRRPDAGRGR